MTTRITKARRRVYDCIGNIRVVQVGKLHGKTFAIVAREFGLDRAILGAICGAGEALGGVEEGSVMATLIPFPARTDRTPPAEQRRHPFAVIIDMGDEELERAERFLMRGRSIENLTTGDLGRVTECRRNGMAIEAKFWPGVKRLGDAMRSEWVLVDLLSPAPGAA